MGFLRRRPQLLLLLTACVVFLGTIVSPPSLMDDVDGAYAQIARTMLESGDWVTARLNGVKYFDKPPGQVWAMAISFAAFGVHDWAARLPMALAAVLLCWTVFRFGRWAFDESAGFWAGLALAACVGMWLFTRVRIPDVYLALSVTISIFCVLRLLEEDPRRRWAACLGLSAGVGMLCKGLPAVVFPAAATVLFLLVTRRLFARKAWQRLHLSTGALVFLLVAAPWHLAAIARNPPYFDFVMQSESGVYRGFFWRYFINEHILRYLGLRHPKDYDTVPALVYWPMHLLWLFPWSALLPAALKLPFRAADRAGRARLMALCWLGFVLVFFAFSTSQEYYTMAAYPAFALLLGNAAARGGSWARAGMRGVAIVSALAFVVVIGLLVATAGVTPSGELADSLERNPDAYRLALGHMQDLTLQSFAHLRGPLALAGAGFLIGAVACWRLRLGAAMAGAAVMMALFVHAGRWAMVSFDPYLSSRPLAEARQSLPGGALILDDQYYTFSSLVFYLNEQALLYNGRVNNIEYGSYAPGAPDIFLDDEELTALWRGPTRCYLAAAVERIPALAELLGQDSVFVSASAGGKALLSNRP